MSDIVIVAQKMIAEFGDNGVSTLEARARIHAEVGGMEGAAFWARVAGVARALLGQPLPSR